MAFGTYDFPQFYYFLVSSSGSFFSGVVIAKMDFFSFVIHAGSLLLERRVPTHPSITGSVIFWFFPVSQILGPGDDTEIGLSIIQRIPIDMVGLQFFRGVHNQSVQRHIGLFSTP